MGLWSWFEQTDWQEKNNIIKREWGFCIENIKTDFLDINNLYLEKYPNLALINNCKDFKILERRWDEILLEIKTMDWEIKILKIYDWEKKNNGLWVTTEKTINFKDKIQTKLRSIDYIIYTKDTVTKCTSSINNLWKNFISSVSSWYEKEEDKKIYRKYFSPLKIINNLLNLFKRW